DVLRSPPRDGARPPPLIALLRSTAADVIQDRGDDVFLHQAEQIQVGEGADVIELELLGVIAAADTGYASEGVGQKRTGEVELPAADDITDLPVDPLRRLQDGMVVVRVGEHGASS